MYLIDTCAFLWFPDDNPKLSAKTKEIIEKSSDLYLSIASLWEIAIKTKYLEKIQQLPLIHADPFDRLIMSTALEENLLLITHDSNIQKYDIDLFW